MECNKIIFLAAGILCTASIVKAELPYSVIELRSSKSDGSWRAMSGATNPVTGEYVTAAVEEESETSRVDLVAWDLRRDAVLWKVPGVLQVNSTSPYKLFVLDQHCNSLGNCIVAASNVRSVGYGGGPSDGLLEVTIVNKDGNILMPQLERSSPTLTDVYGTVDVCAVGDDFVLFYQGESGPRVDVFSGTTNTLVKTMDVATLSTDVRMGNCSGFDDRSGNILLNFHNVINNTYHGYYVIVNKNGDIVKSQTKYDDSNPYVRTGQSFPIPGTDRVVVGWWWQYYYTRYMVVDSSGEIVKPMSVLDSSYDGDVAAGFVYNGNPVFYLDNSYVELDGTDYEVIERNYLPNIPYRTYAISASPRHGDDGFNVLMGNWSSYPKNYFSVLTHGIGPKTCSMPPDVTVSNTVTLWPPNGKYQTVTLDQCGILVNDRCQGAISLKDANPKITCISSDEPEDEKGNGDGITKNDIVIVDSMTAKVRAERAGAFDGRVYSIHFQVSDLSGNISTGVCKVGVPHDNAGPEAVDSGVAYKIGDCK
uniref:hypothetical protein n=1 Tax=Candidatus Electronema sp. TaxID=2698783 RepID=UPI0040577CDE